jgi:peptidoglycan/LPS O-acetylase OafA/YrhL
VGNDDGRCGLSLPIHISRETKKLVEWLGIILTVGSYLLISKDTPWPRYLAIFPVLGSFLIIQAQRNDSLITSNIVFQKIGVWSYSIYLWHWPLVVYMYKYMETNIINITLLMAASVILGMLSNVLVERKVAGEKY